MIKNKIIKTACAFLIAATCVVGMDAEYTDAKKKKAEASVDLNGEYHAALGLQTSTQKWIYRLGYYNDKYAGKKEWGSLATGEYGTEDYTRVKGKFTDAVIAGNGTYTVTLHNAYFDGEKDFSQLHVSTDIPDTGQITFSNMVINIDGNDIKTYAEPYIDKDPVTGGYTCLVAINNWRTDLDEMNSNCVPESNKNDISITFTVDGFNYDNPSNMKEEISATVEPEVTPTATAAVTSLENVATEKQEESDEIPRPVIIISVIVIAIAAILGITIEVNSSRRR